MTLRHHIFENSDAYPVAILAKATAFNKTDILVNYVEPLRQQGIPAGDVVAFTLAYNEAGKAPVAFIKEHLATLMPELASLGARYLYVADANYFKVIAGVPKAEPHHGYVMPCKLKGYEAMHVVLGINHQALIYNPEVQTKLDASLCTLAQHVAGDYQAPGTGIIKQGHFPQSPKDIQQTLGMLMEHPSLAVDIEGFSLNFDKAGIGTIAFAWDQHHGAAFACDYLPHPNHEKDADGNYGSFEINEPVRQLLRDFFESYQGELTFHYAPYDVKAIVFALWMQDPLDRVGMLKGLDIMTRGGRLHDTKVITYLATNSTAGNVLGLKSLAHGFAGNWAKEEINDIRRIPLPELLQYNLVDTLSTHYVRDKYFPIMVRDNQHELYKGLMLDSLKLIIQMELVGMPMSDAAIQAARTKLEGLRDKELAIIQASPLITTMNHRMQVKAMEDANAKLKVKQHPLTRFSDPTSKHYQQFNPNSGPQLQILLYELMSLPVIDYTDTKQPATGAETIEKLINHTQDPDQKALLAALIANGKVTKILSTFIPAFEAGLMKDDGMRWLHGCFNLGGTVSGRLSSSDPNMQNLPAGSTFGKLVKECFQAPSGWLFGGADFNSLEDYISALTTKDPNKLNVYLMGFDGHCLRAAYYFRDQLAHIDLEDPKSVNTIKKTHPELRQDSKAPTFALTYQGTAHTLMTNLGWPEDKAKAIEANYHELYKVSDEYVQARLKQASEDGYVEVAFGLRVRTPLLKQVIWGSRSMPYEAAAEGRTAGNALGQSYGLLNNRAAVAFFKAVWESEFRYDILPVALIHDAIYILMRDDARVVEFANRELIQAMRWQELPELHHDVVKLGAALDLFWPSWANPTTLPNDADQNTIKKICKDASQKYLQKAV